MVGFVLAVEMLTAIGNGVAVIAGAGVGVPLLLFALIGDVLALVAVSRAGRAQTGYESQASPAAPLIVYSCSQCGWEREAQTTEQAKQLRQQHLSDAHGGTAPTT